MTGNPFKGIYIFGFVKILQLCNKVPYPEKDGGAIAISTFTRGLIQAGHSIKMLAMNTVKHYVDESSIPEEFKKSTGLETVDIDNTVNAFSAFVALMKGESYNAARFESKQYAQKLQSILQKEEFDIVELEGLYLSSYIPLIRQFTSARIIMRAHNVEYKIWEGLANEEKNPLKKIYLSMLARQLKKYEANAINLCDGVITFTAKDMQQLRLIGCKVPLAHIPFGVDISKYIPAQAAGPNTLFYLGALDWQPNIQGLDWFLKEVWPKVNSSLPEVKLHIAGRNMPPGMKESNYPNVVFHGEVENALDFIKKYSVMIIPLLAGSGVRIKIIEGMAMGKPIITTAVGIDGIECEYGKDVMVANRPDEFYKTIVYCIENPDFLKQLAANGRNFAQRHYNIQSIIEALTDFYKKRINEQVTN
jgi:glycosyltransferase involved in cell wall biosynthesis